MENDEDFEEDEIDQEESQQNIVVSNDIKNYTIMFIFQSKSPAMSESRYNIKEFY